MWEQYADKHKGICLVFDIEKLKAAIAALGLDPLYAEKVRYGPPPVGRYGYPSRELDHIDEAKIRNYFDENSPILFFRKTIDWASEREYRFVTMGRPLDEELRVSVTDALEFVVLGEQLPYQLHPSVKAGCEETAAKPLLLGWGTGRPRLSCL